MNKEVILQFNNSLYLFYKTLKTDYQQAKMYLQRSKKLILDEYKKLSINAQYAAEYQVLLIPEYLNILLFQLNLFHEQEMQKLPDTLISIDETLLRNLLPIQDDGDDKKGFQKALLAPLAPRVLCAKLLYLLAINAFNNSFIKSTTSDIPIFNNVLSMKLAQFFVIKAMNCPQIFKMVEFSSFKLHGELIITLSATYIYLNDAKSALEVLLLNIIAFKMLPAKTKMFTIQLISQVAGLIISKLIKLPINLNPLMFHSLMHVHDSEYWNFVRTFLQSYLGLSNHQNVKIKQQGSFAQPYGSNSQNNEAFAQSNSNYGLRRQNSNQKFNIQEQRIQTEYGMDNIIKCALASDYSSQKQTSAPTPQSVNYDIQEIVKNNVKISSQTKGVITFEQIFKLIFDGYPSDFFQGNQLFNASKLQIYVNTYLETQFKNTKIEQLHTVISRQHRTFLSPPEVAIQFQHLFNPEKLFTDLVLQSIYQRDSRLDKAAELQQIQNNDNQNFVRKTIDIAKLQRISEFSNGYCMIFNQKYYFQAFDSRLQGINDQQRMIKQHIVYPTNEFIDYQLRMCRPDKEDFKKESGRNAKENANLAAIQNYYEELKAKNLADDKKFASQLIKSQSIIENIAKTTEIINQEAQTRETPSRQKKFDPNVTDYRLYDEMSDAVLRSITTKTTRTAFERVYYDRDRLVIPPKFDLNMLDLSPFSPRQQRNLQRQKDLEYKEFTIFDGENQNTKLIKGPCPPRNYKVLFKKWEYMNDMGQSLKQIYQARRALLQKSLVVVHFVDFEKLLRKLRKSVQEQIALKKVEFAEAQRVKRGRYQKFNMYDALPMATDCQYYRRLRHQGIILNQDQ